MSADRTMAALGGGGAAKLRSAPASALDMPRCEPVPSLEQPGAAARPVDPALPGRMREVLQGVIGQPLRQIGALAERLKYQVEPEQADHVQAMVDAAQRTDAMLRDLVEFVELYVSGTTPISRRKVDLKLLCERVIDSMQGSNPESSIVFTCGASVEGCWDPDRLAVLLSRLIENALEHGPARRPIRVTVAGSESSAVLEVASARPIIDAALLAHIFEPFVRGTCNPLDGDSGLGLGLFLAQAVARAHGGQINLTCDSVTGTTFRVTLPRA